MICPQPQLDGNWHKRELKMGQSRMSSLDDFTHALFLLACSRQFKKELNGVAIQARQSD